MQHSRITRYALFLMIAMVLPMFSAGFLPKAHAPTTGTQYYLTAVPSFTQEGYTIVLVLTVIGALPSTPYQFTFQTKDPSGKIWTSSVVRENTTSTETSFSKLITYPSPNFLGNNSLCCFYNAQVNQISPIPMSGVVSTPFDIIITDKGQYQRTETVGIRASGYGASESATVTIRTQTTSTLVFSKLITASGGIVSTAWKIPNNATIDNYVVTVTGTTTTKNPPDAQGFAVTAATMTISTLTSSKTSYQRTETMSFSFQASYPDGSLATTGIALLTLARPSGGNVTLTANYDDLSQSFTANYKTSLDNQTGTWTATLAAHAFGDGYGNAGPSAKLTNTPQLIIATFIISVNATTYVPIGQNVNLNATITYPDGTNLTSGTGVGAYLLYSGSPPVNRTMTGFIFDTTLQKWVGSYSPQSSDPGGLYSLVIKASDSPNPPNTGSATKAVTLQDKPPAATFTPSTTSGLTGTPISFNGTGSYDPDGAIVTWSWTFGDTTTGSGSIVVHTYATAGTYTVTLTVTDNGGYTASTSSTVTVQSSSTGSSNGNVSFPLYYFGILAALIAAILAGGFLAFRRHKVTHAKLKIDLEAVKSEAGRIENQEFFQSVKDQLKKDKDD